MIRKVSQFIVLAYIISQCCAQKYVISLSTDSVGGDSVEHLDFKPLVVHVDKNSMSPEILSHLASTSNIVFADLPDFPQFININEVNRNEDKSTSSLIKLLKESHTDLKGLQNNDDKGYLRTLLKELTDDDQEKISDNKVDTSVYNNITHPNNIQMGDKEMERKFLNDTTLINPASSAKVNNKEKSEVQTYNNTTQKNMTSGNDFDNSSNFVFPTTIFTAIALTLLIFIQTY